MQGHLGANKKNFFSKQETHQTEKTKEEKCLGVWVDHRRGLSYLCDAAVKRANAVLVRISKDVSAAIGKD